MINKIFALCDMEFKRIYKVYFLGILTLIGMNIILFVNRINELLGKDIYNFFDIQSLQPFVLSNSRDFFMIDTLGVVCAVLVIFMCTIISMVYKKIALIVYPAVIYFSMFFYFLGFYEIKDDMNIFLVHIVYFIFLIILSLTVSSKLLKDKINF